jgi:hypothetical protein
MPSATQRPKPRDLRTDAFFQDEWASSATAKDGIERNTDTGCHLNRFDVAVVASRTATLRFANPLQDASIALQLENGGPATGPYEIFVPTGLGLDPPGPGEVVPVTLYAGPGKEFRRHGLRTFFNATTSQVLVGMPGVEAPPDPVAFGFGITKAQIDQLFGAAGLAGVSWQITVLVAFSTGYRGINGVINNTKSVATPPAPGTPSGANPGLGLDLSGVKKIVFMDCLYRGDDPGPGRNTDRALTALDVFTGGTCSAIVYEVTGDAAGHGGTPRDNGKLRANFPPGMSRTLTLLNLKPLTNQLLALILARRIHNGILDKFTNEAEVRSVGGQAIIDLIELIKTSLPNRNIASSAATGSKNLANWAPNATCNQVAAVAEALRTRILIGAPIQTPPGQPQRFANELMGWPAFAVSEVLHDGFMSEFGWEHMTG